MTNPELTDKAVGVVGSSESSRQAIVEMAVILRIQMTTISGAKTPPTIREDLDATQSVDGIVIESIRCLAADVLGALYLADDFYVPGNREIEGESTEHFIRTVKQDHIIAHWLALRIAVENVANVGSQIHAMTESGTDQADYPEVANTRTRTSSALHFIEARKTVGPIRVPAIERNNTCSESAIRIGKANLGAHCELRPG